MARKPAMLQVEMTCADPSVAFRGAWPGPEGPDEILAVARNKAVTLGVPVQIEIRRHGVWSIDSKGRVVPGRLFRPEKLASGASERKGRGPRSSRKRV